MTSEEVTGLVPCPFCGKPGDYFANGSVSQPDIIVHRVTCINCECEPFTGWRSTKAEAVAAWNRRSDVALTTLSATIDELRGELAKQQNAWQIYSGDLMSATNELDREHERAEAAESQLTNLREALEREREGTLVVFIDRPDGGLSVSSPDLPGLILSGPEPAKVAAAIPAAIRALREHAAIRSRTTGDVE